MPNPGFIKYQDIKIGGLFRFLAVITVKSRFSFRFLPRMCLCYCVFEVDAGSCLSSSFLRRSRDGYPQSPEDRGQTRRTQTCGDVKEWPQEEEAIRSDSKTVINPRFNPNGGLN